MRILIAGGGPAGLYLGILLKRLDAANEVTLLERDGPDDTFGWGIVFSDQTFSYLEKGDAPSCRAILESCILWDDVDVVHRDEKVAIGGNRFSGVARIRFLNILHARCRELGVDLRFHTQAPDLRTVTGYDLVVGADGARSAARQAMADLFQPAVELRRNKFIWLGTRRPFSGLTLTFREGEAGWFAAHSYKFSSEASTFIIECAPETWARGGFDGLGPDETCRRLEAVFARDLGGEPLLTNSSFQWRNFPLVKNGRWHDGRVVLLGDALHTAHFSIGSGTKLALEDSIALAASLAACGPDVPAALAHFEASRRPVVEALQAAAFESLVWFEQFERYMHLDAVALAYSLMTRSGRIDHEKLRRRDPAFVAEYERRHGAGPPRTAG
jgi:anthraniloyl-CoA monooxygenase